THDLSLPLQWSAPSHKQPVDVPVQLVAASATASAGHAPEVPVQLSATSHWPAEARHCVPPATKTSTHDLSLPLQWSAPSHKPPVDVPVQLVAAGATASAGHAPEVPVQLSATSHWPAEARHCVPPATKTSTHDLSLPLQWSAPSHKPPVDVPVQLVAAGATASAGHAPEVPVQLSATSHWPAEARHCVPPATKTSTHDLSLPLQWSAPS